MKPRKWNKKDLVEASRISRSIRQVLFYLGLKEAGGNYSQIKKYLQTYKVNTVHFKGKGWNKGLKGLTGISRIPLQKILTKNSTFQSYKLKNRLFKEGFKVPKCEECGWAQKSPDGRLPLELDHINGNASDNRLENLRILCPNCHSLKPTHRGRNTKLFAGMAE
ncbi:hypothetical protein COX95_00500 [bacterium CG_4_10_14_0_2_um_filter_33_32]|nr:MAG: hypothetical protein COU50_00345 [bacterium CG10_big_fil_rev_8_21_14_0_10_33_18]PIU76985.1 MAG: hypothetical protein COS74_01235 [bacterium CG06_land_8_20_14_3_00_33_50]PIW81449.1 MAG: hypothetical protein COZ97_01780 [bacterium CG_4_8_14_3_um_filter_33_28]PIY85366.1 MAG: hypothetical protein COY76_02595 [bacterium CG_4_10_14_0_8_um_filter_33_57]PIZ86609.1 MAG: hypothetical protein COX95_00500 [bacterium CG_4_10_14_0_2_um_filter_33_32]PJA72689.1 MAG: hypothetical protein CO152_00160 [b